MATRIPLSEALRLGSMATEQTFERMYGLNEDHQVVKACALGAIFLALGGVERRVHVASPGCPVCGPGRDAAPILSAMIMHLNDYHRWNRERIADWLAAIEQQSSCVESEHCNNI